jgi:Fe(3+) dicitrate transport protein
MHARFLRLPLLLAIVCAPSLLFAQSGTLEGTVFLSDELLPASYATVHLIGTVRDAVTDSGGNFRIDAIPAGRYVIEAHRAGAAPVRLEAVVRPAATTQIRVVLGRSVTELVGVEVVGSRRSALARLPGSASVVNAQQLEAQQPLSANEVLRRLPGVHLQEEEGAGLRANIGLRGLDPDRSRTVLVLEDGVPVSLAPYGEPELYYSPPIDRMERLEVVKGSGSIVFGPQTIGGVINYVTASAPVRPQGRLQLQGGSGGALLARATYGGSWGPASGIAGVSRRQATDLNGLHYSITDVTGKAGVETPLGTLGLKLSSYDERSNATYVGLTDSLFRHAPHVHPQPEDDLRIRRVAATATHDARLGGATELRTNIYAYRTSRDWNRRDYTYNASGSAHVFANTTGSRDRTFDVFGVEPRLRAAWSAAGIGSELDAGFRLHHERTRDQYVTGSVGSAERVMRDDELRHGTAVAAFIQNRVQVAPALQITPGLRVEHFEHDRRILRTRVRRVAEDGTITRAPEDVQLPPEGSSIQEFIPGVGAAWSPTAIVTVFAGAHRGFSPPRTKDALVYLDSVRTVDQQLPELIALDLDAERSWNYELGTRLAPARFLSVEATIFHLAFSNQIIQPSASRGTAAHVRLANQGETSHEGIELDAALDLGLLLGRAYSLTASANITAVQSRFSADRFVVRAPGDTVNLRGNRLPYAPRRLTNAAIVFDHPAGVMLRVDGSWVGEQFADLFDTRAASPDGRVGAIPSYRVFDLSARFALRRLGDAALLASVKNLLDDSYIASRRPEGIKPGLPRLATVGVSWGW